MKKILFSKKYGLTTAVIEELKTQTRRIIPTNLYNKVDWKAFEEGNYDCIITDDACALTDIRDYAAYRVGEEVAVAQSYEDMANEGGDILANMLQDATTFKKEYCGAGWKNAMFTKASLMPHRIRITNIRIERLQDISEEDCLKEGVQKTGFSNRLDKYVIAGIKRKGNTLLVLDEHGRYCPFKWQTFETPREAFAALINKTCGRGTWRSNPYVFVYEFELIK